jgi:hypothetical protein
MSLLGGLTLPPPTPGGAMGGAAPGAPVGGLHAPPAGNPFNSAGLPMGGPSPTPAPMPGSFGAGAGPGVGGIAPITGPAQGVGGAPPTGAGIAGNGAGVGPGRMPMNGPAPIPDPGMNFGPQIAANPPMAGGGPRPPGPLHPSTQSRAPSAGPTPRHFAASAGRK